MRVDKFKMAGGERRETDFMNRSLDEIAAEMDSSLYDREERDGHHRPQHRYSPYPADHVPSWRAEKEGGNGSGAASGSGAGDGDGNRVFVANLNYTVTWQQVKDLLKTGGWASIRVVVRFSWKRLCLLSAGPVMKCDLFKNADGSSRVSSNGSFNIMYYIIFSLPYAGNGVCYTTFAHIHCLRKYLTTFAVAFSGTRDYGVSANLFIVA